MKYRSEIDGLRSIAVFPVIFYHLGFPGFSGGYVGVDIFFVISGYLITGLIYSEVSSGKFSIIEFYERRARRIIPALFVVIFVSSLVALNTFMPRDILDFSQSVLGVLAFSSNIVFWKESGYFEAASELKPLLHTWSLGVEEQYYILFPLFLLFFRQIKAGRLLLLLFMFLMASLFISEWAVRQREYISTAGYFLLPSRAWELLLGSLLAIIEYRHGAAPSLKVNQVGSIVGLIFIMISIFTFTEHTSFPGFNALLPTVGAALILFFARESTFVLSILRTKVLVFFGLLSYSLYLWHQPLIAFFSYELGSLNQLMTVTILLLTFASAFLSWKFIETPFRSRTSGNSFSRRQIFAYTGVGTLFFLIGAGYLVSTQGQVIQLSDTQREFLVWDQYDQSEAYRVGTCFLMHSQSSEDFGVECVGDNPQFVLWGDSHAAALSSGFKTSELIQKTASGCPPLAEVVLRAKPNCKSINEAILEELRSTSAPIVILHANWLRYDENALMFGLAETLRELSTNKSVERVIVLGGVPQWGGAGLPTRLAKDYLKDNSGEVGFMDFLTLNLDQSDVLERDLILSNLTADYEKSRFLSVTEELCNSTGCNAAVKNAESKWDLFAWDYGHLTQAGALHLVSRLFGSKEVNYITENRGLCG